jgi:hypothetical protein
VNHVSLNRPFLAAALSLTLALSGCVGSAEDPLSAFSDDETDANMAVSLSATNASEDLAHIGAELDGVFVHDASADDEGYYELSLDSERADVVAGGSTSGFDLATGDVPAGSYDEVLLRSNSLQAHGADAMSGHGGHGGDSGGDHAHSDGGHDDGGDDHAHGDDGHNEKKADGKAGLAVTTGAVDVPVPVDFEVSETGTTSVEMVLDAGASTSSDALSPVFDVTVTQDGETVTETRVTVDAEYTGGEEDAPTDTPRPAARAAVYAPNGDQLYEPNFDVEDGAFANSASDGIPMGEEIRFTATESDAVADGAALESFEWDFGDGATATGQSVQHAYDQPGVFPVTLTVTDSNDVSNTHTVHVVVTGWSQTMAATSFEEGPEDWTGEEGYLAGEADQEPAMVRWELDSPGHDSDTAWHVNHFATDDVEEPGYVNGWEITLESANYTLPEDTVQAGFNVSVLADISTGTMTAEYEAGGETQTIATTEGTDGWIHLEDKEALSDHAGDDVVFRFTFQSFVDEGIPEGQGVAVDNFQLGGLVEDDMANADLLEKGDHDGHDHEH